MAGELIELHREGDTVEVERGLNTLHDLNAEIAETLYRLALNSRIDGLASRIAVWLGTDPWPKLVSCIWPIYPLSRRCRAQ